MLKNNNNIYKLTNIINNNNKMELKQNKRGIIPIVLTVGSLIVAGIIILLIMIGTGVLLTWIKNNIITIIGAGLVVIALLALMKDSGGKRMKFFGFLLVIGLFVVVFGASGIVQQSVLGQDVYVPVYSSVYCTRLPTQVNTLFSMTTKEQTFHCGLQNVAGVGNVNAYVPYGCKYYPKQTISYKVCNEEEDCSLGFWGTFANAYSDQTIVVNYGQKVTFYAGLLGNPTSKTFTVQAEPYGLLQGSYNGKVLFSANCDIRNLNLDYIPEELDTSKTTNGFIIPPTLEVANYIVGQVPIQSSLDVITFKGKEIYVFAPGKYYNIVTSDDGRKYTNTLSTAIQTDNDIKCMPSTPYCTCTSTSCEVKLPTEKTCSEISGNIEGYLKVSSTSECKYTCNNGVLTKTTDCRTIQQCPSDKPILDPKTGECIAAGGNLETTTCNKWYQETGITTSYKYNFLFFKFGKVETPVCKTAGWVYLAAFGILILIIAIVYILTMKPSRRRSRK